MTLRTFRAGDGTEWTVWLTSPGSAARIPGTPKQWLSFQNADATVRARLFDIPKDWETMSDERLDLLRRVAQRERRRGLRHSPPDGGRRSTDRIPDLPPEDQNDDSS